VYHAPRIKPLWSLILETYSKIAGSGVVGDMAVQPKYAENIIVAVVNRREWAWYVSAKDLWLMDWRKWAEAWGQNPDETDYSGRFGIQVLDMGTAKAFFQQVSQFRVTAGYLRNMVAKVYDYKSLGDFSAHEQAELLVDLWHLIPSLMLDFDTREFVSNYPEADFTPEQYLADGWMMKQASLFEIVPKEHRYWIIDGRDAMMHFAEILQQASSEAG